MSRGAADPQEAISWEELLTRLPGRRTIRVRGDRITLWLRPAQRLRLGLIGVGTLTAVVWLWDQPAADPGAPAMSDQPIMAAGIVVLALVALAGALGVRPFLVVDGEGLRRGCLAVRWRDVDGIRVGRIGEHVEVEVLVDPDSQSVNAWPALSRWLHRRQARRRMLRSVRLAVATTRLLNLRPDEVQTLLRHPAAGVEREGPGERPTWAQVVDSLASSPGVTVLSDEPGVVVTVVGRERLRLDARGIHGHMPDVVRTIAWRDLQGLSLVEGGRQPAVLLVLQPGTAVPALTGRGWRRLADLQDQPVVPIPWAGMPLSPVAFARLVHAHPGGEHVWRAMRAG